MPELPEVETTRRGIEPHLRGRRIEAVVVRERRLRWPVPASLEAAITGARVDSVSRRAKYLLIGFGHGTVLIHLGMSGSLCLAGDGESLPRHAHWDWQLDSGRRLRFVDPRRFGSLHWWPGDPGLHPLLAHLGPEPDDPALTGDHLYEISRGRRASVKAFIMDSTVVVGVGNIYASEALFRAGIHPRRPAGRIARKRYRALVAAIREVLTEAIAAGGTTLRDFTSGEGSPGYFEQSLNVYGRAGSRCPRCAEGVIYAIRLAQRATYYCNRCQT